MNGASGRPLRIATRASELALRQARQVQDALGARGVGAELVTFTTTGDRRLDRPLSAIGGKGLFTQELEAALTAGEVDCCVHSLKDLPTASPPGLSVVAVLPREDPRDALVVRPPAAGGGGGGVSLGSLPAGARVGTSSLRRRAQLLAVRPDLEVVELRGNVPTRLRKVDEGQVDAAILAAAGLHRLGERARVAAYLDPPGWLPAPGQGAIAVQARAGNGEIERLLAALDDAATMLAVRAERAFLAALEGGCQVPIGALAVAGGEGAPAVLHGLIADLGGRAVRGQHPIVPAEPELAGRRLADALLAGEGGEILAAVRAATSVPAPQPE